mmetsp:Transcript_4205/g.13409  ORF Transcript_4205/g.13409 Transcript_4205/m.13409 type:complete len:360 (+) Transcript_4205:47-1126(+)
MPGTEARSAPGRRRPRADRLWCQGFHVHGDGAVGACVDAGKVSHHKQPAAERLVVEREDIDRAPGGLRLEVEPECKVDRQRARLRAHVRSAQRVRADEVPLEVGPGDPRRGVEEVDEVHAVLDGRRLVVQRPHEVRLRPPVVVGHDAQRQPPLVGLPAAAVLHQVCPLLQQQERVARVRGRRWGRAKAPCAAQHRGELAQARPAGRLRRERRCRVHTRHRPAAPDRRRDAHAVVRVVIGRRVAAAATAVLAWHVIVVPRRAAAAVGAARRPRTVRVRRRLSAGAIRAPELARRLRRGTLAVRVVRCNDVRHGRLRPERVLLGIISAVCARSGGAARRTGAAAVPGDHFILAASGVESRD